MKILKSILKELLMKNSTLIDKRGESPLDG